MPRSRPAGDRSRFLHAVERALTDRRVEIANVLDRGGRCALNAVDALDRNAVVATLHALGYLITRSVPIRQVIPFFRKG